MNEPYIFDFFAMGTDCEMQFYAGSAEAAQLAAKAAQGEVERIERAYSRYRQDSIVLTINRAAEAGDTIGVDEETAHLIDIAFEAYRLSDGLFDITSGILREIWNDGTCALPSQAAIDDVVRRIGLGKVLWRRPELTFTEPGMQIDLGGIAKEYAAGHAAGVCRAHGIQSGIVNLGGDIAIVGPHPHGAPWRIGVRDPKAPETAMATLFVSSGGVATSGDYERYWEIEGCRFGHILNPATGWPASGLLSVTVAAETCLAARPSFDRGDAQRRGRPAMASRTGRCAHLRRRLWTARLERHRRTTGRRCMNRPQSWRCPLSRQPRLPATACRQPRLPLWSPHAPVAQLDRVQDSESWGHRFKSCRVRHSAIYALFLFTIPAGGTVGG